MGVAYSAPLCPSTVLSCYSFVIPRSRERAELASRVTCNAMVTRTAQLPTAELKLLRTLLLLFLLYFSCYYGCKHRACQMLLLREDFSSIYVHSIEIGQLLRSNSACSMLMSDDLRLPRRGIEPALRVPRHRLYL